MGPLTIECLVHDLNNVFQTLGDAGEVLSADRKWRHLASTISRAVEQGKSILASLAAEQPPSVIPAEELLSNAVQFSGDFLAAAGLSGILFLKQIEPELRIWGHEAAIERVMVNLLLNAAQAMPMGGEVEIRAASSGGLVQISIGDRGPGIPLEILPNIFRPHFTTRAARSGLGLHIVATIVRENDGMVVATNRSDGPGALFTVSLPAATRFEKSAGADS